MPDKSAVSVVIPCYDDGRFLLEAVESVLKAASSAEILVVDDGSTDAETLASFESARDLGCQVIDRPHAGLSAARNAGIEAARVTYILPLDSDDRLREGFVDEAVALLEADPDTGVVYGARVEFGDREALVMPPEPTLETILWGNTLHVTCLYRKALWADVGGYDTALPAWEDWEFWIHALARGWAFRALDRPAYDYRIRADSLVNISQDQEVVKEIVAHVVAKHRDLFMRFLPERLGPLWLWPAMQEQRLVELEGKLRQLEGRA